MLVTTYSSKDSMKIKYWKNNYSIIWQLNEDASCIVEVTYGKWILLCLYDLDGIFNEGDLSRMASVNHMASYDYNELSSLDWSFRFTCSLLSKNIVMKAKQYHYKWL